MKEIEVTGMNRKAIVDDADYPLLITHKWSYSRATKYPRCRDRQGKTIYMHRLIMGLTRGDKRCIDHINGDVLDNRRSNLRVCTRQQNACNKRNKALPKSGFRGVRKQHNRWQAILTKSGKTHIIGSFADVIEAAKAYDKAAVSFFGEFACTNAALGLL